MNVDVNRCARCGQDHEGLEFRLFDRPCGEWTHWAMCPVTQEPILCRIEESPLAGMRRVGNGPGDSVEGKG